MSVQQRFTAYIGRSGDYRDKTVIERVFAGNVSPRRITKRLYRGGRRQYLNNRVQYL